MSFTLTHTSKAHCQIIYQRGEQAVLPIERGAFIEGACFGRLIHNLRLDRSKDAGVVMLIRDPRAMLNYHMLVDQGPVEDGEIVTLVFNLSNRGMRIPKAGRAWDRGKMYGPMSYLIEI